MYLILAESCLFYSPAIFYKKNKSKLKNMFHKFHNKKCFDLIEARQYGVCFCFKNGSC